MTEERSLLSRNDRAPFRAVIIEDHHGVIQDRQGFTVPWDEVVRLLNAAPQAPAIPEGAAGKISGDGQCRPVDAAPKSMRSENEQPMLPELCKALGWQGGTIHQVIERVALMRAALREITRGAGPYNRDPLTHADNCIESMKSIAVGALEGTWSPE